MDFSVESSFEILSRTPQTLNRLMRGLADEWLEPNYGRQTWSAHDVVGHLIWGERTDWMPRLRHTLKHGDSLPFEPFDREGHRELCQTLNTAELLDVFEKEREENLQELREHSLTETDLEKVGLHPAFGKVLIRQLLATWTVHDLNHIAQISKAMAFQYRDAVGPWEAYLSILSPPNPR